MKAKRKLFSVSREIGSLLGKCWLLMALCGTILIPVPLFVQKFPPQMRFLCYVCVYCIIAFAPLIIIHRSKSKMVWLLYRLFGVEYYFHPTMKGLKKISVKDKIKLSSKLCPFVKNEQVYSVINECTYIYHEPHYKFSNWPWICYELQGEEEGEKIFFSLVNSDKIKFSKKIKREQFFDSISPLTETDILILIAEGKDFTTRDEIPLHLTNWIIPGKHIFKNAKTYYLNRKARGFFSVNKLLKKNKDNFQYCFISEFTQATSEIYKAGTVNTKYSDRETMIEINVKQGKINEVFFSYGIDIVTYEDWINSGYEIDVDSSALTFSML